MSMPYKLRHAQDAGVEDVAGLLRDADQHRAAVDDQEGVQTALDDPAILQHAFQVAVRGKERHEFLWDPVADAADPEGWNWRAIWSMLKKKSRKKKTKSAAKPP